MKQVKSFVLFSSDLIKNEFLIKIIILFSITHFLGFLDKENEKDFPVHFYQNLFQQNENNLFQEDF